MRWRRVCLTIWKVEKVEKKTMVIGWRMQLIFTASQKWKVNRPWQQDQDGSPLLLETRRTSVREQRAPSSGPPGKSVCFLIRHSVWTRSFPVCLQYSKTPGMFYIKLLNLLFLETFLKVRLIIDASSVGIMSALVLAQEEVILSVSYLNMLDSLIHALMAAPAPNTGANLWPPQRGAQRLAQEHFMGEQGRNQTCDLPTRGRSLYLCTAVADTLILPAGKCSWFFSNSMFVVLKPFRSINRFPGNGTNEDRILCSFFYSELFY